MTQVIEPILERYGRRPDSLIMVLQDIQDQFKYLPREAMEQVARELGVSMGQVYWVGTYYRAFNLQPCGRHTICVCTGTACHVRGAKVLLDKLTRDLDVKVGGTTRDKRFTVRTVRCVGACALAPIVSVDAEVFGRLDARRMDKALENFP